MNDDIILVEENISLDALDLIALSDFLERMKYLSCCLRIMVTVIPVIFLAHFSILYVSFDVYAMSVMGIVKEEGFQFLTIF